MQGINGNESQKNLSNNSNFNENILDEVKIYCGNLKIYTVYGFLDKSNYRNQSHLHNSYELHVVISGSANMVVSGREIKISRNSIIIIPPNTEHHFQPSAPEAATENDPVTAHFGFFLLVCPASVSHLRYLR